ncbi:MAG TPA: hypothetical protein VJB87_00995 [Candidatus Nanoarchaeia archaeon]|nr:hypothetical protein [Candidatus Nanoarchaeia archaeon]
MKTIQGYINIAHFPISEIRTRETAMLFGPGTKREPYESFRWNNMQPFTTQDEALRVQGRMLDCLQQAQLITIRHLTLNVQEHESDLEALAREPEIIIINGIGRDHVAFYGPDPYAPDNLGDFETNDNKGYDNTQAGAMEEILRLQGIIKKEFKLPITLAGIRLQRM